MSNKRKFTSFKEQQMLVEGWRGYVSEDADSPAPPVAVIEEQKKTEISDAEITRMVSSIGDDLLWTGITELEDIYKKIKQLGDHYYVNRDGEKEPAIKRFRLRYKDEEGDDLLDGSELGQGDDHEGMFGDPADAQQIIDNITDEIKRQENQAEEGTFFSGLHAGGIKINDFDKIPKFYDQKGNLVRPKYNKPAAQKLLDDNWEDMLSQSPYVDKGGDFIRAFVLANIDPNIKFFEVEEGASLAGKADFSISGLFEVDDTLSEAIYMKGGGRAGFKPVKPETWKKYRQKMGTGKGKPAGTKVGAKPAAAAAATTAAAAKAGAKPAAAKGGYDKVKRTGDAYTDMGNQLRAKGYSIPKDRKGQLASINKMLSDKGLSFKGGDWKNYSGMDAVLQKAYPGKGAKPVAKKPHSVGGVPYTPPPGSALKHKQIMNKEKYKPSLKKTAKAIGKGASNVARAAGEASRDISKKSGLDKLMNKAGRKIGLDAPGKRRDTYQESLEKMIGEALTSDNFAKFQHLLTESEESQVVDSIVENLMEYEYFKDLALTSSKKKDKIGEELYSNAAKLPAVTKKSDTKKKFDKKFDVVAKRACGDNYKILNDDNDDGAKDCDDK
tara:strand:- start:986 stop:2812 length:1827 start_codon:yes stop_codon:yes gene_type:complete